MRARLVLTAGVAGGVAVLCLGGPLAWAAAGTASLGAPTVSVLAGGTGGPGPAKQVPVTLCGTVNPCPLKFAGGRLYFGEGNALIRAVAIKGGRLTTPVGNGFVNSTASGIPATATSMDGPAGTTLDGSGNLIYADMLGSLVRVAAASSGSFYGQAMTAGDVYTIAGTGARGFTGDGGPAVSAELIRPVDVAVDHDGNVLIACNGESSLQPVQAARVRVVAATTGTFYGQAMTAGDIYTIAGSNTGSVVSGNGGPATAAGLGLHIGSLRIDKAGNLILADSSANEIRVVAASTGTFYGQAMTARHIYVVAGNGTAGFSGDGGPATSAALNSPAGATADNAGNLVIADTGSNRIRVVAAKTGIVDGQAMTAGHIYTVAGGGTSLKGGVPALKAELRHPTGIAVDGAGNTVYAGAFAHRLYVMAGKTGTFYGVAMTAGHIYSIAGNGKPDGFSGDGGPATAAEMHGADGVAVDQQGDVFIGDSGNWRIRIVAARTGSLFGRTMTAGHIYTLAGTGQPGHTGDGGPATAANIFQPEEMSVDHAGNLLAAMGQEVRLVAAKTGTFYGQHMTVGHIYTIVSHGFQDPTDVAVAPNGNLVISDRGLEKVLLFPVKSGTFFGQAMTARHLYPVGGNGRDTASGDGGPALHAGMDPRGVAVDSAGNLVIADGVNERVRVIAGSTGTFYGQAMTAAHIYTIASTEPGGVDIHFPLSLTIDASGNVVVCSAEFTSVLVVADSTGTFYGQAMTAGDVYPVAGEGPGGGFDGLGDGGPALTAKFGFPIGIAIGPGGEIVIADNNRIRAISS